MGKQVFTFPARLCFDVHLRNGELQDGGNDKMGISETRCRIHEKFSIKKPKGRGSISKLNVEAFKPP